MTAGAMYNHTAIAATAAENKNKTETCPFRTHTKPGVVAHTCNLGNQGRGQEDQDFEASIDFKASLSYTTPLA